jgi:hypothetical protein
MQCPYCIGDIDDAAQVCRHCRRDLHMVLALQSRIAELEQQVTELTQHALPLTDASADEPPAYPVLPPDPAQLVRRAVILLGLPLLLLLGAHALIVLIYDANTLWLRIVSLLIPLPFGLALANRGTPGFGRWVALAFVMALAAVLGMSWATGLVDHTPVLPQDRRELREFVEYAASIGLSFIAGLLIGNALYKRRTEALRAEKMRGVALKLARLLSTGQESAEKLQTTVKKLKDISNSLSVAGTAATSAYMGLKEFFGG